MTKAAELAKMGEVLDNSQIGRKNIIINGGMQIAQRATSSTGLGSSNGYFTCDRWRLAFNTSGRITSAQDGSDTPDTNGFANCLKLSTTSEKIQTCALSHTKVRFLIIVLIIRLSSTKIKTSAR